MFKIGKLVYAFLKAVGNINLENVLISKEYRPAYNISFLTHTVTNVSLIKVTTSSFEVKLTNISSSYTPIFEYFAIR